MRSCSLPFLLPSSFVRSSKKIWFFHLYITHTLLTKQASNVVRIYQKINYLGNRIAPLSRYFQKDEIGPSVWRLFLSCQFVCLRCFLQAYCRFFYSPIQYYPFTFYNHWVIFLTVKFACKIAAKLSFVIVFVPFVMCECMLQFKYMSILFTQST